MYFTYTRQEAKAFSKFLLNDYFTPKNTLNNEVTFNEIKKYIDSISECVKCWFYTFNPSFSPYSNVIKKWLEKLNRLKIGSFAPLIMSVLVNNTKEERIVECLKEIERFIFLVFKVTNRKAITGNSHFYKIAHDYYYDNISIERVIKDIDDFIHCRSNNYGFELHEFENNINTNFSRRDEGFYKWSGIKYFLYEYELYLKSNISGNSKVLWADIKADSIEHIYPEKPNNSNWGKVFGKYKFVNKEKYRLLHSIGNLVLLSSPKNAELHGSTFDDKKKSKDKQGNYVGYFNGSFSEIEVAQYDKWTPETIYARGVSMLEFMESRWGIEINDKSKILGEFNSKISINA